jgi:uncharacterized protein YfbU (UPF0304 family)
MAEHVNLSKTERLILLNQYSILEQLARAFPDQNPDKAVEYARNQEVLRGGEDILIQDLFEPIADVLLTAGEQTEILDILDMFRHLQNSYDDAQDKEGLDEESIAFDGWEAASATGELGFATRYCYRTPAAEPRVPDRYAMIRPSPAFDGNRPVMARYRRMLAAYEPTYIRILNEGWRFMTIDEIKNILDARDFEPVPTEF